MNTFVVPFEISYLVSLASSIMETIVEFVSPFRARFPVKLISCIAVRSASSACCLLKSIAVIL